ncbi:MAG: multicopper oxidase domain-containing protein [Hyphomicrobiaceae bacterium]
MRKLMHLSTCIVLAIGLAQLLLGQPAKAELDMLGRPVTPALQGGQVRSYYVAAEELDWDYAPFGRDETMGREFTEPALIYVERKDGRVGRVHRKALLIEYTDDTFRVRKPKPPEWAHTGLLGPILRAEVGDTIRVVFKNKTSRPYSLHPHGVFYSKAHEGAPSNDGTKPEDKRDDSVKPGDNQVYVWPVPVRAGPGPRDQSSIAWLYHSHVDRIRDTNSGLIGAIVVTRRGMAEPDGKPKDVDREIITLWKIFDETQSWYIARDVKRAGGDYAAIKDDPAFKASNRKHTINGFIFGNLPLKSLTVREGERVRWYVTSLGSGTDIHTPYWHGNTVLVAGRRMDAVPLLPAQLIVADMVPDNVGIWMLQSQVENSLSAGMTLRYQVLPREKPVPRTARTRRR